MQRGGFLILALALCATTALAGEFTAPGERVNKRVTRRDVRTIGAHISSPATFVSAAGVAGADATAQTVLTRQIPGDTLRQVGDRLRVRTYFNASSGTSITGATKIGPPGAEVTTADTTHSGGASLNLTECWIHYIDNTHANIIEQEAGGLGNLSAINVAGFAWNKPQNIIFTQTSAVGTHTTVYGVFVDILPKGVQ